MKNKILIIIMALFLLFSGCLGKNNLQLFGNGSGKLIIVNNLAETLGTFYIKNEAVNNNILTIGQSPNQIVIKNNLAYVVNSLSNSIQIIDLSNNSTIREISLGAGKNPMNIAIINSNKAYVTNFMANTIDVIDPSQSSTQNQIIKSISLSSGVNLPKDEGVTLNAARPQGAVIKNGKLYVCLANFSAEGYTAGGPGLVCVIDTTTDKILKIIQLNGRNANGIYTDDNLFNKIYVACTGTWIGDGTIEVIDTSTDTLSKTYNTGGAPGSIIVHDDKVYVGDIGTGEVDIFNKDTNSSSPSINRIVLNQTIWNENYGMIGGLALEKNGNLYITEFNSDKLYVLDTNIDEIKKGPYTVGDGPSAVAIY